MLKTYRHDDVEGCGTDHGLSQTSPPRVVLSDALPYPCKVHSTANRRYQSTVMGSYQSVDLIETFISYQESIKRCIALIVDPNSCASGTPSLKVCSAPHPFFSRFAVLLFTAGVRCWVCIYPAHWARIRVCFACHLRCLRLRICMSVIAGVHRTQKCGKA